MSAVVSSSVEEPSPPRVRVAATAEEEAEEAAMEEARAKVQRA